MADKSAPAMRPTDASVADFLASVPDERRRADAEQLCRGPYSAGKGCLYFTRLAGDDPGALRELIDRSARVRRGVDRAAGRSDNGCVGA